MKLTRKLFSAALMSAILTGPVYALDWQVEITNLTHGVYFTPLLVTAHGEAKRLFEPGMSASAELQAMAEGGDTSGLLTDLGGEDMDTVNNPAGGLLMPGATTSLMLAPQTDHTMLSLVAMILPSNDAFVGLDSISIPTTPGTYTFHANAYDAGTEVNNELIDADGGMPGTLGVPAGAADLSGVGSGGSGVADSEANMMVHIHRGVLGDTDATGGRSDLDSRVHRWLNPVARIVVTVQ